MFQKAGVKIPIKMSNFEKVTLEKNIYSYPKGLLEGKLQTGKLCQDVTDSVDIEDQVLSTNVLLACTGCTAADNIFRLTEACLEERWNVKVVTTKSAEQFWKHHAGRNLVDMLGAEKNI